MRDKYIYLNLDIHKTHIINFICIQDSDNIKY